MKYSDVDVRLVVNFLRKLPVLEEMTVMGISWFIRNDIGREQRHYTAWCDFDPTQPSTEMQWENRINRRDVNSVYEAVDFLVNEYEAYKRNKAPKN